MAFDVGYTTSRISTATPDFGLFSERLARASQLGASIESVLG
jgi:hypothetical protein